MVLKDIKKEDTLFDLIPQAILIVIDRGIVYSNKRIKDILGWDRDELIGACITKIFPPGKELEYRDLVCQKMESSNICHLELEFRHKDGRTLYCRIGVSKLNTEPSHKGFIVTIEDITKHKEAEMSLNLLEKAISLSDIVVFIWTPVKEGDVKFVTDNIVRFGYKKKDFLEKKLSYYQIVYPEDLNTLYYPKLEEYIRSGKDQFTLEYRIVTGDGNIRWVQERTYVVRDENGNIIEYHGILIDITEKVNYEEKLRESERKFRLLFERAPIGIGLTDAEGKAIATNPTWQRMIGYTEEELKSITWKKFTYPEDIDKDLENFKKLLDGEIDEYTLEKRFIRKDGSIFWGRMRCSRIEAERGNFLYELGTVEDVTEKRLMEEELRLSYERIKKSFDDIISVLSRTVELKDPYTTGHQRKVMLLSVKIAERLGFPLEKIEGIRIASYIHDIGKITIPSEILNKPGRLNSLEFAIVKTHPTSGFEILKDIDFPWPIAKIILQHHERLDGSGYPLGLRGENILLEARIIAVADVIEAMTSHRPYRPALNLEDALGEIEKNKGILYDARVVDACIEIFKEGFKL
ncbi:PAS domain S-box protein [bacterium]|nr:PAS domain S-box protein [bacterium]